MPVFRLPDLGEGLTEAQLVTWLVSVGDEVRVDQPIAEVETAKSAVEVPSPFAGVVSALHGAAGDVLSVGAPLMEVGGADVELDAHRAEERAGTGSGNVLIGYGTSGETAAGRTRRKRGSRVPAEADAPAVPGPVAVRSPIVRRLAQERGVDLHALTPTGVDGAITRADVLRAAASSTASARRAPAPTAPAPAAPAPPKRPFAAAASPALDTSGGAGVRTEPLSMLRRTVAAKMSRSRTEIPEATVWVDVDATGLWELRRELEVDGAAPSLTAFFARFVLSALAEYPVLCARLSADGTALEHLDGVHLGIASDTDRGLLVPVVRHAERMDLARLDAAIRELTAAARAGTATPGELAGSTFTLNNYGSLGVDGSAAIINHPEVAILGIGRMIERPWVVGGSIVPRRIVTLSLVFDHRVCDGGYASGFLRTVVDAIEHPARRLLAR